MAVNYVYDPFFGSAVYRPQEVVAMEIQGRPIPQIRHRCRFQQGRRPQFYDPAAANKTRFANAIKDFLLHHQEEATSRIDVSKPFFEGTNLLVVCNFSFPRPLSDFHGRLRDASGIRDVARQRSLTSIAADTDNCLKFTMDAMQDVIFANDRQVVSCVAMKTFHDEGNCEGKTTIVVYALPDLPMSPIDLVANAASNLVDAMAILRTVVIDG